jgi:CheY-like chemotaxis protein
LLLVNELLDFRKIQSGSVRLRVGEHDVVRVLKTVIAAFEHTANEKDIQTTFVSPERPVMLWFDIAQMQKVFYDQLRVFIRELFEGEFKTLEAENGLRGLELANEHIPDIILSDVMMPEMNGLEVCNRLKSNVTTSHILVVLVTARTQNEQIICGAMIT